MRYKNGHQYVTSTERTLSMTTCRALRETAYTFLPILFVVPVIVLFENGVKFTSYVHDILDARGYFSIIVELIHRVLKETYSYVSYDT